MRIGTGGGASVLVQEGGERLAENVKTPQPLGTIPDRQRLPSWSNSVGNSALAVAQLRVRSTDESKTDDAMISKLTENSSKIVYNIRIWMPSAAGGSLWPSDRGVSDRRAQMFQLCSSMSGVGKAPKVRPAPLKERAGKGHESVA